MSRYTPQDALGPSAYREGQTVMIRTDEERISYYTPQDVRGPSAYVEGQTIFRRTERGRIPYYRRELLTQQTILQNTLDKLFSEILPNELQADAEVVKLWNDLNQPIVGPRGGRTKAGRRLEEYLGDDFGGFAALVEDLKGLLNDISNLINIRPKEHLETFQGPGNYTLHLRSINSDLDRILSNRKNSRDRVLKVADRYQKSLARSQFENDTASVTSVETEPTSGEPALSFLPVSLSSIIASPNQSAKALLDTGATASCISEELASDLGLITTPSDKEVILTASKEQKIFHNGEAKLKLSWKNKSGEIERVKVIVYVVPGLALPLLLSHDFTMNHRNVWDVADATGMLREHVAVLGFGRLSKKQRAAEKTFEQGHAQVNRDKDEEMIDAERAELEKRLGVSASSSSARSEERSGTDSSSNTQSQSGTSGQSS